MCGTYRFTETRVLFRLAPLFLFPFIVQQMTQLRKRVVGGCRPLSPIRIFSGKPLCVEMTGMLVIMAVNAQQLPIAAIGRVVVVIMVFVMNRQLAQFFSGKITTAFPANPGKDL